MRSRTAKGLALLHVALAIVACSESRSPAAPADTTKPLPITSQAIAVSDSLEVVTGQTVTRWLLECPPTGFQFYGRCYYTRTWSGIRIIGFVGSSRGTTAAVDDTLLQYTAPQDFEGVDTVRAVYEAYFGELGVMGRDTAMARFSVRRRGPPPGPYDVTAIVGPSSTGLIASGLSVDGRVAGTVHHFAAASTHAFRWRAGLFEDLGLHSGARTVGVGINTAGDVAGYAKKADSSIVGLVWRSNGTVSEVLGQPYPIGITDDGFVVTSTQLWKDGQKVRTESSVAGLTNSGHVIQYYGFGLYPSAGVHYADGRSVGFPGRGNALIAMNDSTDVWARIDDPNGVHDNRFYARTVRNGTTAVSPIGAIWPEFTPPGVTGLRAQKPLKLDNARNLLETDVLVTPRGAFRIDDYIADPAWELVEAITMNDRGQILGIGRQTSTGLTTPILLTPRGAPDPIR